MFHETRNELSMPFFKKLNASDLHLLLDEYTSSTLGQSTQIRLEYWRANIESLIYKYPLEIYNNLLHEFNYCLRKSMNIEKNLAPLGTLIETFNEQYYYSKNTLQDLMECIILKKRIKS